MQRSRLLLYSEEEENMKELTQKPQNIVLVGDAFVSPDTMEQAVQQSALCCGAAPTSRNSPRGSSNSNGMVRKPYRMRTVWTR